MKRDNQLLVLIIVTIVWLVLGLFLVKVVDKTSQTSERLVSYSTHVSEPAIVVANVQTRPIDLNLVEME